MASNFTFIPLIGTKQFQVGQQIQKGPLMLPTESQLQYQELLDNTKSNNIDIQPNSISSIFNESRPNNSLGREVKQILDNPITDPITNPITNPPPSNPQPPPPSNPQPPPPSNPQPPPPSNPTPNNDSPVTALVNTTATNSTAAVTSPILNNKPISPITNLIAPAPSSPVNPPSPNNPTPPTNPPPPTNTPPPSNTPPPPPPPPLIDTKAAIDPITNPPPPNNPPPPSDPAPINPPPIQQAVDNTLNDVAKPAAPVVNNPVLPLDDNNPVGQRVPKQLDNLDPIVNNVNNAVTPPVNNVANPATNAATNVTQAATNTTSDLVNPAGITAANTVSPTTPAVNNAAPPVTNPVANTVDKAAPAVTDPVANTVNNAAPPVTNPVANTVDKAAPAVTDPVSNTVDKAAPAVTNPVTNTVSPVVSSVADTTAPGPGPAGPAEIPIVNTANDATKPVVDTVNSVTQPTTNTAKEAISPISGTVEDTTKATTDAVKDATQPGLSNTVDKVVPPAADTVKDAVKPTANTVDKVTTPTANTVNEATKPVTDTKSNLVAPDADPVSSTLGSKDSPKEDATTPLSTPKVSTQTGSPDKLSETADSKAPLDTDKVTTKSALSPTDGKGPIDDSGKVSPGKAPLDDLTPTKDELVKTGSPKEASKGPVGSIPKGWSESPVSGIDLEDSKPIGPKNSSDINTEDIKTVAPSAKLITKDQAQIEVNTPEAKVKNALGQKDVVVAVPERKQTWKVGGKVDAPLLDALFNDPDEQDAFAKAPKDFSQLDDDSPSDDDKFYPALKTTITPTNSQKLFSEIGPKLSGVNPNTKQELDLAPGTFFKQTPEDYEIYGDIPGGLVVPPEDQIDVKVDKTDNYQALVNYVNKVSQIKYNTPYANFSELGIDNVYTPQDQESCTNMCQNLRQTEWTAIQDLVNLGLMDQAPDACAIGNIRCDPCGDGYSSCITNLKLEGSNVQAPSKRSRSLLDTITAVRISLPGSFQSFTNLSRLAIVGAPIVGNADFISTLPLTFLQISNTLLTGDIPSFSQPNLVQAILLTSNYFTGLGSLSDLGPYTQLQQLDLSYNILEGKFPLLYINANQPKMSYIDLSNNNLQGAINGNGIEKMTSLFRFCVSNNFLEGTVPYQLQSLESLEQICLGGNNFQGNLSLNSTSMSMIDVEDNPSLCVTQNTINHVQPNATVAIFANAMGESCLPGEPMIGLSVFNDTTCGMASQNGQALLYKSSSGSICFNSKTQGTNCSSSCLQNAGSILIYGGVGARFWDCAKQTEVLPFAPESPYAQCIDLSKQNVTGTLGYVELNTQVMKNTNFGGQDGQVQTIYFIASIPFDTLFSSTLPTVENGAIPFAILTSDRFSNNARLQSQIKIINRFKAVMAFSTQNNAIPCPMLVRVVQAYNQSDNVILDVQAVFDSNTDPIFVQSFISILTQDTQQIFGQSASIIMNDQGIPPIANTQIEQQLYGIETAILPQDFNDFYALDLETIPNLVNKYVPGWPIDVEQGCKDFINEMRAKFSDKKYFMQLVDLDNPDIKMCDPSVLKLYASKKDTFQLRMVNAPTISRELASQIGENAIQSQGMEITDFGPSNSQSDQIWSSTFTVKALKNQTVYYIFTTPGAISGQVASFPSQVMAILVDTKPPKPEIKSNSKYTTTDNPQPSFTVDFGKSLITKNAGSLFELSGVASQMGFYNPLKGQIQIICSVQNSSQTTSIVFEVPAGMAQDFTKNKNEDFIYHLNYTPPDAGVNNAYSTAMGTTWGVGIAGAGIAAMGGLQDPTSLPGGGITGLFMLWATQKFTYKRQIAVPNLPEIYKQCYTRLEWVIFNFPLPWERFFEIGNDLQNVTKNLESRLLSHNRNLREMYTQQPQYLKLNYSPGNKHAIPSHIEYFQRTKYQEEDTQGRMRFRNLLGFSQNATSKNAIQTQCNAWGPLYRFQFPNQQQQQQILAANSVYTSKRKMLSFMDHIEMEHEFDTFISDQGMQSGRKSVYVPMHNSLQYQSVRQMQVQQLQGNYIQRRYIKQNDHSNQITVSPNNNTQQQAGVFDNVTRSYKSIGLQSFQRIIFWCILLFIIVVVLHALTILLFVLLGRHPPDIMLFPRLELTVSLLFIPPMAGAGAALFNNNGALLFAGVAVILFGPFLLSLYYHTYIWYNLVFKPPQQRKANYMVQLTNAQEMHLTLFEDEKRSLQDSFFIPVKVNAGYKKFLDSFPSDSDGQLQMGQLANDYSGYQLPVKGPRRYIYAVLSWIGYIFVGPPQLIGEWEATMHPDSKYMAKLGALFEDCRGRQVIRHGASYDIIPSKGGGFKIDRGQLIVLKEPRLFKLGNFSLFRSDFAVFGLLMEATKVALFAVLVKAIDLDYCPAQVIAMMCISIVHALYVRFLQPFRTQRDAIIVQIGNMADIGTFICAILLLGDRAYSDKNYRWRVGLAMIVMEFISLVGYIMERVSRFGHTIWRMCIHLMPWERNRGKLLANLVQNELQMSADLVASKHLDRWMRLALGRGLRGTNLRREEQNFRAVIGAGFYKNFRKIRTSSGSGTRPYSSRQSSDHQSSTRQSSTRLSSDIRNKQSSGAPSINAKAYLNNFHNSASQALSKAGFFNNDGKHKYRYYDNDKSSDNSAWDKRSLQPTVSNMVRQHSDHMSRMESQSSETSETCLLNNRKNSGLVRFRSDSDQINYIDNQHIRSRTTNQSSEDGQQGPSQQQQRQSFAFTKQPEFFVPEQGKSNFLFDDESFKTQQRKQSPDLIDLHSQSDVQQPVPQQQYNNQQHQQQNFSQPELIRTQSSSLVSGLTTQNTGLTTQELRSPFSLGLRQKQSHPNNFFNDSVYQRD